MAAEHGEEKLIAVARHIAKTLGHTDTMTDDILQIFTTFDGRFSREKLSDKVSDEDHRSSGGLDDTLSSLDRRISHYVSADHSIWSNTSDSASFLDSIDELLAVIRDWSHSAGDKTVAVCLDRAEDLLRQAMFRLEDEFRSLMERGGESFDLNRSSNDSDSDDAGDEDDDDVDIPVARPVTDYNIVIDALPSGTISDLHEIAKRMVIAGFEKECSHVYSSCRRDFLDESLSRLGLQKLSTEEVHMMQWSDLEDEVERWTKSANVALQILFPSERRLCDRVFFGFSIAADLSFMEVCRGTAIQLLNFADAIAIGSRSPERLFKVLDVYETLRDLIPEFELLFSDNFSIPLRNEAVTILKRLGESILGIFMELENLIRRDPAKQAVPSGGLHPITRYVMNYLRAACKSQQTLVQVFEDGLGIGIGGGAGSATNSTSLSVQMAWIMELLESNLEAKSKIYHDPALSAVFMMNNGRYIFQKLKDSELGALLGEDWIRKHGAKIRQFHVTFQRSSWNKVLAVLKVDNKDNHGGNAADSSAGLKSSMKERLKIFNASFEETLKAQSSWVLFDDQMRVELKISVSTNLLPAYRNFLLRFQSCVEGGGGRHAEKYVKYSVEDVERKIDNELFAGNNQHHHHGRR